VAFLNGGTTSSTVTLDGLRPSSRVEYILAPGDERGLQSRLIRLNGGNSLNISDELPGRVVPGFVSHLQFPAQRYGFFVLKGVGAAACASQLV
jgi:hypothetical protein